MYAFLSYEYRKILLVFLSLGSLFAYFYHREVQREEAKAEALRYHCFSPGLGLNNFHLGQNLSAEMLARLGFEAFSSSRFGLFEEYRNSDASLRLHLREGRLRSVAYWPVPGTRAQLDCDRESQRFEKHERRQENPLEEGDLRYWRYPGLVVIKAPQMQATGKEEWQRIAWMVTARFPDF